MRRARIAPAAVAVALLLAAPATARHVSVAKGKQLYGRYCVACHGANGAGISSNGSKIGFGPGRVQSSQKGRGPSLRGVGAMAASFYLRTGYMPLQHAGDQPRRTRVLFNRGELRSLVAYVASLGKGPTVPKPHPKRGNVSDGLHSFTEHCAGCHQVVAQGGYVKGAVAPPLDQATPTQIAEAVRIGPYLMPHFSQRAISNRELDSIIRYVQYAKHPDDRGGWAIGHVGPVPEGLVTWFIAAAVLVAMCLLLGKRLHA